MTKHLIAGITMSVVGLCGFIASAQGTKESVNVVTPGSLRELINDLPAARINNLTITGSLNGEDVAYLVGGTGKMSKVDSLDIAAVKLVGDDKPYRTLLVDRSDVGFGTTTEVYYLSERDTIIYTSESTGLGGASAVNHVFCNDLSGAFAESGAFKHIVMPQDLKKIGNYQFFKNTSVASVVLPPKATTFGRRAFDGASALTSLAIPEGIKSIPERSVRCTSLERVDLPAYVDSIYQQAFSGAPITDIELKNVKFIDYSAFNGNLFHGTLDLSSLEQMGTYAFNSPGNEVDSILFSDKLRIIPDNAFSGFGLKSLILPDYIEEIGSYAFAGCKNLDEVTLPASLTQIYSDSFANTPWAKALKGEDGVIYAGTIALQYDYYTYPKGSEVIFKEGTTIIADSDYRGFFPFASEMKIETVNLPSSLKRIGSSAFSDCRDLKSITLPEGLLSIGQSAFRACHSLKGINLPDGITEISDGTFTDCKSLEEISIPQGVTYIGANAFENDELLYLPTLPDSLRLIGEKAFLGCKSIPFLTLPENLDSIGAGAFGGCSGIETVTIKSKKLRSDNSLFYEYKGNASGIYKVIVAPEVTNLPAYMFGGCPNLTKLVFENIESSSLTRIGDYCFDRCTKLEISALPKSLEYIGIQAFYENVGLEGILQIDKISHIAQWAFGGWKGLTELTISTPEIFIDYEAFAGCSNLKKVTILSDSIGGQSQFYAGIETLVIGPTLTYIPILFKENNYALKNLIFHERGATRGNVTPLVIAKNAFRGAGLTELALPNGTLSLGEYAFASNRSLEKVEIPDSCLSLGSQSFAGCDNLRTVNIGEGLQSIGELAFSGCLTLPSIVLPSTCEEIGLDAFRRCDALQTLTLLSETPPSFGGSLGYGIDPVIMVPEKSLEAYKVLPILSNYLVEPIPDAAVEGVEIDKATRTINAIYTIDGQYAGSNLELISKAGVYVVKYSDGTTEKIHIK